ncbi:MAG: DUF1499 domain-containing protein [Alphaproteobacteria bacterium]
MDWHAIPERNRPNSWLIAPPGFCNRAPDGLPPTFALPVAALRDAWRAVLAGEPRLQVVHDDADGMDLVQRTAVFRFADDIAVAYVDLGSGASTLALYSRSRIGYSDLGANRRRLERWLGLLAGKVPAGPALSAGSG